MKALKTVLCILFLSVFVVPYCIAIDPQDWNQYQNDRIGRGWISNEVLRGHFGDTTSYIDGSDGMIGQMLVLDIDGDGSNEILRRDSSSLDILNYDFDTISTVSIGSEKGTPAVINISGINFIITKSYVGNPSVNNISVFSFNGSGIYLNFTGFFENHGVAATSFQNEASLKCWNQFCWWLDSTTTFNRASIGRLNLSLTDLNFTSYNLTAGRTKGSLSINDIDNDGDMEIAINHDDNTNGEYGVHVMDAFTYATVFQKDDVAASDDVATPIIFNLDEVGTAEVFTSYKSATSGIVVKSYDLTGNTEWTYTSTATDINNMYDMAICNIDGSDQFQLCVAGSKTDGRIHIDCIDKDGDLVGTFNDSLAASHKDAVITQNLPLVCADMDNDGLDEIVTSRYIIDNDFTVGTNLMYNSSFFVTLGDVNNDNSLDILLDYSADSKIYYSDFTNRNPVLNNSKSYGGYIGWYSGNTCINTTTEFRAYETGDYKNYDNDVDLDQERIVTDCGGLWDDRQNGTFSPSSPSIQCYWNATGSYLVTIFIQDTNNTDNFTGYNTQTIPINVINGIPGVTCNTVLVTESEDVPVTTTESEEITSVFENVLLGNALLGLVVAMMLIVGAIFAAASVTHNSFVISLVAFLVMGACTVFGLLTAWVMILFIIVGVMLLVLKQTLFNQTE